MTRRLLLAFAVAAGLGSVAAPAASACEPGSPPDCYVDCLNRPPWIDTRDPVGTVKGAIPTCPS